MVTTRGVEMSLPCDDVSRACNWAEITELALPRTSPIEGVLAIDVGQIHAAVLFPSGRSRR